MLLPVVVDFDNSPQAWVCIELQQVLYIELQHLLSAVFSCPAFWQMFEKKGFSPHVLMSHLTSALTASMCLAADCVQPCPENL